MVITLLVVVLGHMKQEEEELYSKKISSIKRKPETDNHKDDDNSFPDYNSEDFIITLATDEKLAEILLECCEIADHCYKKEYVVKNHVPVVRSIFIAEVVMAVTSVSFLSLTMLKRTNGFEKYAKDLAVGLVSSIITKNLLPLPLNQVIENMDFRYDIYKEEIYPLIKYASDKQSVIEKALNKINRIYSGDIGMLMVLNDFSACFISKQLYEKTPEIVLKTNKEGYQETIKALAQKCFLFEERLQQIISNYNNSNKNSELECTSLASHFDQPEAYLLNRCIGTFRLLNNKNNNIFYVEKNSYDEFVYIVELYIYLVAITITLKSETYKTKEAQHEFINTAIDTIITYITKNKNSILFKRSNPNNIIENFMSYYYCREQLCDMFAERLPIYSNGYIRLDNINREESDEDIKFKLACANYSEVMMALNKFLLESWKYVDEEIYEYYEDRPQREEETLVTLKLLKNIESIAIQYIDSLKR